MTNPEVYKRADGLYDWRLRATNGQIIATSGGQGYTERNDAQEAVEMVIQTMAELEATLDAAEALAPKPGNDLT